MEGFVRLDRVLTPTAVYVLWWEGEVVSVGRSKNIYGKVAFLRQNLQRRRAGLTPYDEHARPIEFDDVWVKFVPEAALEAEERVLVAKFGFRRPNPFVRPGYDLSRIPAIAELLRKREGPRVIRRMPYAA